MIILSLSGIFREDYNFVKNLIKNCQRFEYNPDTYTVSVDLGWALKNELIKDRGDFVLEDNTGQVSILKVSVTKYSCIVGNIGPKIYFKFYPKNGADFDDTIWYPNEDSKEFFENRCGLRL